MLQVTVASSACLKLHEEVSRVAPSAWLHDVTCENRVRYWDVRDTNVFRRHTPPHPTPLEKSPPLGYIYIYILCIDVYVCICIRSQCAHFYRFLQWSLSVNLMTEIMKWDLHCLRLVLSHQTLAATNASKDHVAKMCSDLVLKLFGIGYDVKCRLTIRHPWI